MKRTGEFLYARAKKNFYSCTHVVSAHTHSLLALAILASSITHYCQAIVLVNDTKSSLYVELFTQVDDHIWMRQHNIYQDAPIRRIAIFRATLAPRNIVKTQPFLLNNVTIHVSWGKKSQYSHIQQFTLAETQALTGDAIPHKFTNHHVIRLVDVPTTHAQNQIKAELLYLPHGKNYLRNLLGERRAQEKITQYKRGLGYIQPVITV